MSYKVIKSHGRECYIVEIIQYVELSDWFLSLSNIYLTFWERQNYEDNKRIRPGVNGEDGMNW